MSVALIATGTNSYAPLGTPLVMVCHLMVYVASTSLLQLHERYLILNINLGTRLPSELRLTYGITAAGLDE